jgi:hypothetical protein
VDANPPSPYVSERQRAAAASVATATGHALSSYPRGNAARRDAHAAQSVARSRVSRRFARALRFWGDRGAEPRPFPRGACHSPFTAYGVCAQRGC